MRPRDQQQLVIAVISDQWYVETRSGLYTTASMPLTDTAASAGHRPSACKWLLLGRTPREPEDLSSMYQVQGTVELVGPRRVPRGGFGYVLGLPRYLSGLGRCFRDADIVIVKSNYVAAWLAFLLGAFRKRKGVLATLQVGDPQQALQHARNRLYSAFSGVAAWLTRRTNASADLSFFVSNALATGYCPAGRAFMVVNESRIRPANIVQKPKAMPSGRPFRLLYVGRLSPEKGVGDLLRAVDYLHHEGGITLTVVGDGVCYEELKRLDRENAVFFLGRVPWGSELFMIMQQHDVLVLPSYTEGLGLVLIEAMSQGTPVIGSRVGGIPELIADEETGLLVPPGDHRALAAAIRRLTSDSALYTKLSAAGLQVASENTLDRQMGAALRECIKILVEKRSAGSTSASE